MKPLTAIIATCSTLLITNLSSFSTVAMEKNIAKYSKEQAALVNSLSAIPIVYDIGFEAGHRIFYNQKHFIQTANKQAGSKDIFSRTYLD